MCRLLGGLMELHLHLRQPVFLLKDLSFRKTDTLLIDETDADRQTFTGGVMADGLMTQMGVCYCHVLRTTRGDDAVVHTSDNSFPKLQKNKRLLSTFNQNMRFFSQTFALSAVSACLIPA